MTEYPGKGYINGSKLCALGNKPYSKWKNNNGYKIAIKALEKYHLTLDDEGIDEEELRSRKNGLTVPVNLETSDLSGTFIHPDLVFFVAQWISPEFGIQIMAITNMQRNLSSDNENKYWNNMGENILIASKNNNNYEAQNSTRRAGYN